ncbi:MAG: hypothetical protein V4615_02895 [Bacteroidota bacterium]
MSSSKKDSIFLEGGVIHERDMLAYLNNQLSADQKQQFETLLKADPFAQEALEGLQTAQNEVPLSTSLTSIHKKVRERIGLKDKKRFGIHWSNYAWAAVLLGLLVGIGFVMINFIGNRESNIALNKSQTESTNLFETEQEIKPADIPVTIIPDSIVSVKQIQNDTLKGEAIPSESADNNSNSKAKVEIGNIAKPSASTSTETGSKAKQSEKSASSDIDKKPEPTSVTVPTTQKVVRGSIVEKEETDRVTIVTMDDAMKNFNSGNYKKSSEQFEAILQQQPNNADALYFGGISDYINGNPRKSEKNFDKLLKDGTKFGEGSKWYKANILIQKGKREEARKLLDELSQSNGSYKERAIKKKAEIEF